MTRLPRLLIAVLVVCASACAIGPAVAGAATQVSVFPSPGVKYAEPGTQIVFRGIPASAIGHISVVGSQSGAHTGHIAADSDGDGGSFLPDQPFTPGETVTVSTSLNVLGGQGGSFQFAIANPAPAITPVNVYHAPAGRNGVQHFRSAPSLKPAALTVTKNSAPTSNGDIFVAPQYGPSQDGPLILDPWGHVVWFAPVPPGQLATDFRVQKLGSEPVLTFWEGFMNRGSGRGYDVILDDHYNPIGTVKVANGLQGTDLHEFLLTPQGDAYVTAVFPIQVPFSKKPLMNSVIQEIDVKTGLVLFEWDAYDHVPLSESFFTPKEKGHVFDPYHVNSVSLDSDGNLIVSLRNTWAVYKIDHGSGNVIWTLGSNRSSFKLGSGVQTAFQHAAEIQSDGSLMIFDDGAGPPTKHSQSRAIRVALNFSAKTATLVSQYFHSPPLLSNYEGNAQLLSDGDTFVGWGQQGYFTEFDHHGHINFDAHFNAATDSYRAYRFAWTGYPTSPPSIDVAKDSPGYSRVYVSWNGATQVTAWRVLAGSDANHLARIGTFHKHGFQNVIRVHTRGPYFEVQALAAKNQSLGVSKPYDLK